MCTKIASCEVECSPHFVLCLLEISHVYFACPTIAITETTYHLWQSLILHNLS